MDQEINLVLDLDESEDMQYDLNKALECAKQIMNDKETWDTMVKDTTAKNALETAQDWWQPKDDYSDDDIDELEEELTKKFDEKVAKKLINGQLDEEVFREFLTLKEINVKPNGSLSFFLYDGEWIFGGHMIFISRDENGVFDKECEIY